jgi:hypothetical protein
MEDKLRKGRERQVRRKKRWGDRKRMERER